MGPRAAGRDRRARGLTLTQLTYSPVRDGIASLAIGLQLVVAYGLGRPNMALLIGRQADPRLVEDVTAWLRDESEVGAVVEILTMPTGTDRVPLGARLDVDDRSSSDEIENACVRMDEELRSTFPDLHEIFLTPVRRGDPERRARVQARYGPQLS